MWFDEHCAFGVVVIADLCCNPLLTFNEEMPERVRHDNAGKPKKLNLVSNITMMDRKAIHAQIATLSDKINYLNERLSEEKNLHPVEVDLLNGYARELQDMIESLGKVKPEFTVLKNEEPKAVVSQAEETPEPVAEPRRIERAVEKKTDFDVKPRQLIPEKKEAIKIPDDTEAFLEEEKTVPPLKMQPDAETPVKKKTTEKTQEKEQVSLNERFKKETTALADKLKGKKKSLKDSFDLNERYSFIENLFGGSAEQFNRALQDLGKCGSREEAEQYIKNAETKFAWSEKPDLAKRFSGHVLEMIG